jgi:hypothetical protein
MIAVALSWVNYASCMYIVSTLGLDSHSSPEPLRRPAVQNGPLGARHGGVFGLGDGGEGGRVARRKERKKERFIEPKPLDGAEYLAPKKHPGRKKRAAPACVRQARNDGRGRRKREDAGCPARNGAKSPRYGGKRTGKNACATQEGAAMLCPYNRDGSAGQSQTAT